MQSVTHQSGVQPAWLDGRRRHCQKACTLCCCCCGGRLALCVHRQILRTPPDYTMHSACPPLSPQYRYPASVQIASRSTLWTRESADPRALVGNNYGGSAGVLYWMSVCHLNTARSRHMAEDRTKTNPWLCPQVCLDPSHCYINMSIAELDKTSTETGTRCCGSLRSSIISSHHVVSHLFSIHPLSVS